MKESEIRSQLKRLGGLSFFPPSEEAVAELVSVAKLAPTIEVLKIAVAGWIETQTAAPKPAELRSAIYDAIPKTGEKRRCSRCGGGRTISVPVLVTYEGNSAHVASKSVLDGFDFILAEQMRQKLPENQDIIGGGVDCICVRTGMPLSDPVPLCTRCKDHGFIGGDLSGKYAGQWRWCDCAAASVKRAEEPELIALVNASREKLLRLGVKTLGGDSEKRSGKGMGKVTDVAIPKASA